MTGPGYDGFLDAWRAARTVEERASIERNYNAWRTTQEPDESAFNYSLRRFSLPGSLSAGAAIRGVTRPGWGISRALEGANATPNSREQERREVVALAAPRRAGPAAAAPVTPTLRPPPTAAAAPTRADDFLRLAIPGAHITSADRTPQRQAELIAEWERNGRRGVRPSDNSWHLQQGRAVDVRKTPGLTLAQLRGSYERAGWTVHEALDEGDHFHLAASPPGGGGGGGSRPNLGAPNPQDLMRFIPDPQRIANINLPDVPLQEMPEARPQMQLADKEALLAPLREAMIINPRDTTQDAWDRIQAMLQGAAGAAASLPGDAAVAQLLLAAGGGGLAGFREEREEQRALTREEEEAKRQVEIALAQAGFGIDTANLDTSNQNLNIDWQSGEDVRTTRNANADRTWEAQIRELMANLGIDQGNVQAQNAAAMARGQVGVGATQDQYNVFNQAESAGWEVEQRRALAGAISPGAGLLASVGISPERTAGESPEVANARTAAGLIEVGNVNAGLNSLATEMVMTGRYANPELFDDATIRQVEQAIQQERPQAAINLLLGQMQAQPESQSPLIEAMAAQGSLVASMIKARTGGAQ